MKLNTHRSFRICRGRRRRELASRDGFKHSMSPGLSAFSQAPVGDMSLLTIRDITKSYGGVRGRPVLRAIELDLKRGDYVAIMGESGIGKSTLLNLIAGLDLPDSGSIVLEGVEVTSLTEDARTLLRRRHVGFVFQAFHLLPHLTVGDNVALPLRLNGTATPEARARAQGMLIAVGLGEHARRYPRELSGGEAQRVAIARALVHRPTLLLADEPTGNLDQETAARTLALLREQIAANAGGGILVTHSAAAAATTQRVFTLTAEGLRPAGAK